ncbi:ANK-REP-REGION domain-containing protein [Mycena sanguinolenta]|uniref:ANK-REP-REGION domain-containing protein n=1 Tax=Mycena sanguinolenta TaxID=230812 RepID=A0A8H6XBN6_9AGAR|nr:ANK-REP-REGION domain-containing protein [Mycena sanguinolenta]
MTLLSDLPPELTLLTAVSFLTQDTVLDPDHLLGEYSDCEKPELVPDLPSINALLSSLSANLLSSLPPKTSWKAQSTNSSQLPVDLLQIAAGQGLQPMVGKLLEMYGEEKMAKMYARKESNLRTALDYAVFHEHLEIVKLLAQIPVASSVHHGVHAPLGADGSRHVQYLSIALACAARAANLKMCEILISEGANINFLDADFYDCTVLCFASATQNLELVHSLLKSGADPNLSGEFSRSLLTAVQSNKLGIIQALLAAGAVVNGYELLSYTRSLELFRLFLECGADPNYEDILGGTPLHYICYDDANGRACAELLLQFGAKVEKANRDGHTPVDFAMNENKPGIVKVLEPFVQDPVLKMKIAAWLEEMGIPL